MAFTASKLLEIAIAEIGYKEKASNSQLDSKEANAGSANWTKYARDLHAAGYYQAPKNGYAWCDMFVDWCFLQLGGSKEKGEWLECQTGLYGAGCEWSSNCYRWADRCGTEPRVGAQIFFAKNGKGSEEHTGIVEKFDANYVYTIEGNASNMVKRKTYARNSDYILCYGYPRFDATSNETQATVSEIAADHFSKGDVVKIVKGSNWITGSAVPDWAIKKEWIVKDVSTSDGKVVIDKSVDGKNSVNSPIHYTSLKLVKSTNSKADEVEDELDGGSTSSNTNSMEKNMYKKGEVVQLSTNFKSTEFDCKGKGCCTETIIDPVLVQHLQKIRDHFGKSVNVNSGYRCPIHNPKVGGSSSSHHMKGKAADIRITGVTPRKIAQYAEEIGIKRIGLYETDKDGYFVHIGSDSTKRFWYGQAGTNVTTFKDTTKIDTSKVNTNKADPERVWKFLIDKGMNEFAVAGLMGNILAESNMLPINLQNTFEKKLGMTDAEYTAAVDQGLYTNFVKDGAGYGLVQWTYHTRKSALLKYAQSCKASIGDLDMQLNFLWKELQGFKSMMNKLATVSSVREASDIILHDFEAPADQSESVELTRASFGQKYYDTYATCKHVETKVVNVKSATCVEDGYTGDTVCVKCNELVESGAPVAKLSHDYVLMGKVDATEDQDGYTGDQVCSRCGDTLTGENIPKLDPVVTAPVEDEIQLTVKKSWIIKFLEWLLSLFK